MLIECLFDIYFIELLECLLGRCVVNTMSPQGAELIEVLLASKPFAIKVDYYQGHNTTNNTQLAPR